MKLPTSHGVVYWPDGWDGQSPALERPARPLSRLVAFLVLFALLEYGWQSARETALERFAIDMCTVKPAAALIGLVSPQIGAAASGSRIQAEGGGINILNGCDGTEILFLLCAAFAIAPLTLRQRGSGMLAGVALVFVLNQGRIVALFYAHRSQNELFYLLHGTVAPLVMIVAVGLFFFAWTSRAQRRT
jgi:exosortase/archaeosortase family protein